LDLAAK